jgi:hypothetical protein
MVHAEGPHYFADSSGEISPSVDTTASGRTFGRFFVLMARRVIRMLFMPI